MEIRTTALHTAKATDAKALGGGVLVCLGLRSKQQAPMRCYTANRETGSHEVEELGRAQDTVSESCFYSYCCENLINTDKDTKKKCYP